MRVRVLTAIVCALAVLFLGTDTRRHGISGGGGGGGGGGTDFSSASDCVGAYLALSTDPLVDECDTGTDFNLVAFGSAAYSTSNLPTGAPTDFRWYNCNTGGAGPAWHTELNSLCESSGTPFTCCTGLDTGTCASGMSPDESTIQSVFIRVEDAGAADPSNDDFVAGEDATNAGWGLRIDSADAFVATADNGQAASSSAFCVADNDPVPCCDGAGVGTCHQAVEGQIYHLCRVYERTVRNDLYVNGVDVLSGGTTTTITDADAAMGICMHAGATPSDFDGFISEVIVLNDLTNATNKCCELCKRGVRGNWGEASARDTICNFCDDTP